MTIQSLDPDRFNHKAQQIRAHVPMALTQRGLLPKFTSWRLTQDPSTGLVVLFGVLNDKYIAAHTQTPFGAYFDPRLLQDLETDLQVEVVPSNNEGLRYAFIIDRGQLGQRSEPLSILDTQSDQIFAEETDSHKPIFLTREDPNSVVVLVESSRPTFVRSVVYRDLAERFQPMPINTTTTFPLLRQPVLKQAVIESEVQPPSLLFVLLKDH